MYPDLPEKIVPEKHVNTDNFAAFLLSNLIGKHFLKDYILYRIKCWKIRNVSYEMENISPKPWTKQRLYSLPYGLHGSAKFQQKYNCDIWYILHVCQQKHPTPVMSLKQYDRQSKAMTKPESDTLTPNIKITSHLLVKRARNTFQQQTLFMK